MGEEKAKAVNEKLKKFAEASAGVFEKYLSEHNEATMQEKHDELVSVFENYGLMILMMIPMMMM